MKVFILVDMEGISGIALEEQTTARNPEYEKARHWMTQDVNAAVQGALDGGATEVHVLDGHGANSFYNLVYDELHEGAEYIIGSGKEWYLTGLDSSFDCLLMVGMHAMAGTTKAVLEHTWSTARWQSCRLNGRETGEIGLMAAFAGAMGVPVTLVTGDRAACEEAKAFLGENIACAAVKDGLGRFSARLLPRERAQDLIRQEAKRALSLVGVQEPYIIETPVQLDIQYVRSSHTDVIRPREDVEHLGSRTIRYHGKDLASACYLMQ